MVKIDYVIITLDLDSTRATTPFGGRIVVIVNTPIEFAMLSTCTSQMVQQLDQQEVPEVPSTPAGNLYAAQLAPLVRSRKPNRKVLENADEDVRVPPPAKRRRTCATAF